MKTFKILKNYKKDIFSNRIFNSRIEADEFLDLWVNYKLGRNASIIDIKIEKYGFEIVEINVRQLYEVYR